MCVQAYQVPAFVGQLLSLQLLAGEDELLSELQPDSAGHMHAALATHSAAAAAGMLPTDALAACLATAGSSTPASGSAAAAAAGLQAGNASSGSGCAAGSSDQAACGCCFRPTLAQLAAQAGALCGAPADTLPWLQLLSRYHTLAEQLSAEEFGLGQQSVKDGAAAAALDAEAAKQLHRIVALAGALGSLGAPLPPLLAAVAQAASDTQEHPASNAAALLSTLLAQLPQQERRDRPRAGMLGSACLQQQNLQLSQQQQDCCSFESVGHWVHAERLLRVTPSTWHAHLAEHLLQTPGSSSSSGSNAAAAAAASHHTVDGNLLHLLADVACDWCGEPLPQQQEAGDTGPGSSGGGSSAGSKQQQQLAFGCFSCGAAQYCSKGCSDAAKTVHAANCW